MAQRFAHSEQHHVRMGEMATSDGNGPMLVTIGLGSCIGLVLLDGRVAGLAHVVLPDSGSVADPEAAKYGDLAVPALRDAVRAAGARTGRLTAVLVGGARMFAFAGTSSEIGGRNEEAVSAQLAKLGIPVRARATGGSKGRTVYVRPEGGIVSVKEAGESEVLLTGQEAEAA